MLSFKVRRSTLKFPKQKTQAVSFVLFCFNMWTEEVLTCFPAGSSSQSPAHRENSGQWTDMAARTLLGQKLRGSFPWDPNQQPHQSGADILPHTATPCWPIPGGNGKDKLSHAVLHNLLSNGCHNSDHPSVVEESLWMVMLPPGTISSRGQSWKESRDLWLKTVAVRQPHDHPDTLMAQMLGSRDKIPQ